MPGTERRELFLTICLFSFLVNFGRVAFAPLVEPFMAAFDVGEATAGLVATAVWLGSALPRLPTGYLLTKIRRHEAILGMGVFFIAAAGFTALAPTITLVTVGALLVGLATGVFYIAANPLVSELYPDRVGWAVGLRGTASQLAAVSAPLLVAVALALGSWRFSYAGLAVVGTMAWIWFYRAVGRAPLPSAGSADRNLLAAVRAQWRIILAGIAIVGALGFVWQGVFNFYVSFLVTTKGLDGGTARILLTLVFAAGVPAFALSGRLADFIPYLPLLFGAIGAFLVSLVVLTMVEGLVLVALISVVMGFTVHSVFPVADTYLLASLPDDNRSSAYAVYSASMMLIQAPGSVIVGTIIEGGISYQAVFWTFAIGLGVILVILEALRRTHRLPVGVRRQPG